MTPDSTGASCVCTEDPQSVIDPEILVILEVQRCQGQVIRKAARR